MTHRFDRLALSRRSLLRTGVLLAGALLLGERFAGAVAPMPAILPRDTWADSGPTGPLEAEQPGDVRVLLVHHSASGNGYPESDVPSLLRGFTRFHTGPEKGWPDIAYNFLIDRFGRIWEGRSGSIGAPVIGSATGGNQGYTQLCCFIGDHSAEPPTAAAQQAMVALLAWLADRYGVDTAPGATTAFVSRGSNRHPAGTTVTSPTITGHRTMSQTACPGDAAMVWVDQELPARVTAARAGAAPMLPTVEPLEAAAEPAQPAPQPEPDPATGSTGDDTSLPNEATDRDGQPAAAVPTPATTEVAAGIPDVPGIPAPPPPATPDAVPTVAAEPAAAGGQPLLPLLLGATGGAAVGVAGIAGIRRAQQHHRRAAGWSTPAPPHRQAVTEPGTSTSDQPPDRQVQFTSWAPPESPLPADPAVPPPPPPNGATR